MRELVGKRFKRNKYGLSTWEDTVIDIWLTYNVNHNFTAKVVVMIKGTNYSYSLDEVVFVDYPIEIRKMYEFKQKFKR